MTITKPLVATVAVLAAITLATAPASARKHHHKMTHQTQSEMTNKSKGKTTTGQSTEQMKRSSGDATSSSSGPSGQASPKQTK